LYRAGRYEDAAQAFQTLNNTDDKSRAEADYNRGNALARAGQLEDSIAAYDAALRSNPSLDDARANRALVEKLLQERQNTESDDPSSQPQSDQSQSQSQSQSKESGMNTSPSTSEQTKNDQDKPETKSSAREEENDAQQSGEQQAAATEQDDRNATGKQQPADAQPLTPEQQRQQQATEQWLRQIPDDPSGLLRRKFDYEHRQRRREPTDDGRPLW
jgi:Ca-activated chloride channel family protein